MTTVAVIPVKQLENVKQRLAGLLSAEQRQQLFRAMFEDVLEAVTTCDRIDRLIVVTDDARVADIGHEFGAEICAEPDPAGLIEAVDAAGKALALQGVTTMVFLPADVPLITVEELEVVLDGIGSRETGRGRAAEFMIVPAHDLGGSNCVAVSPPDCMSWAFGEDSFRRHLAIARERGIEPMVAKLPGIGLDIDTRDDLERCAAMLAEEGLETRTARVLVEEGITNELRKAC